jgi:hypothetical protein
VAIFASSSHPATAARGGGGGWRWRLGGRAGGGEGRAGRDHDGFTMNLTGSSRLEASWGGRDDGIRSWNADVGRPSQSLLALPMHLTSCESAILAALVLCSMLSGSWILFYSRLCRARRRLGSRYRTRRYSIEDGAPERRPFRARPRIDAHLH